MVAAREPALSFVLYSEDGGKKTLETLEHLLRGMLKLIAPAAKTNHLSFEPVLSEDTRVHGNHWKTRDSARDAQRLRRELIKAVATRLVQGHVVFFHVDADSVWMDVEVLILAMPAYEIESWAFANTTRLRELLRDERDLAALAGWENDLGWLDEQKDTKDLLSIRDAHNVELVQTRRGFPAEALARVPKSYAATVARLRGSLAIERGLAEAASRPF